MKTIYKYDPILAGRLRDGRFTLQLKNNAHVVHIAPQHPADELPQLWVEMDTDETETHDYEFALVGTGTEIPEQDDGSDYPWEWVHIGSAVCANGQLVWHVYVPGNGPPF